MFNRILVVCTGNICRSPMAEALLAARWGDGAKQVSSAGVHALVGRPAEAHAIEVVRAHGMDIRAHRARQLDSGLVRAADLVLTMEPTQSDWILATVPTARGKVHAMTRYLSDDYVHDPYMQSREVYEDVFDLLDDCVTAWLERI